MHSPNNNDNFIHAPVNAFYVAEDGSWGQSDIILFDGDALSEEQWSVFDNLGEDDRYDYMVALHDGDTDTVKALEEEYAD
jgi:hypothetical protein